MPSFFPQAGQNPRFSLYFTTVKCISCNQRKGRRECPALGGQICTQCCGSKRGIEIKCPDDCRYFGQAMGKKWFDLFHPAWNAIKNEQERNALLNSVNTCFPLVIFLQKSLLGIVLELADPKNEYILEALKLLESGYQAEGKGIIYEPSSTNLSIQTINTEMRDMVSKEIQEAQLPPEILAESFRILVLFAESYISEHPEDLSFSQLLQQFHPTVEASGESSAGIIITG